MLAVFAGSEWRWSEGWSADQTLMRSPGKPLTLSFLLATGRQLPLIHCHTRWKERDRKSENRHAAVKGVSE